MNRFKTALDIQDACNLTAVAGVLHNVCLEVLHESKSTEAVTRDPAVIWIVDKIYDLVHRPEGEVLSQAYDKLITLSKESS
jgi:hypothetical protein